MPKNIPTKNKKYFGMFYTWYSVRSEIFIDNVFKKDSIPSVSNVATTIVYKYSTPSVSL